MLCVHGRVSCPVQRASYLSNTPLSLSQYTLLCVGPSVVLFVLLSIPAIGLRAMLR